MITKKRHSYSHVLAQAIKNLYWNSVKLWIWPDVDNWFYYDFDFKDVEMIESRLKEVQKEVKDIIKQDQKFVKIEVDVDTAIKIFSFLWEPYKIELIEDLKEKWETNVFFYANINTKLTSDKLEKITNKKKLEYLMSLKKVKKDFNLSLGKDSVITFLDMCAWPHVDSTKDLDPKAFKLSHISWAYWKGDEKRSMLTRIYAYAFENESKLNDYLKFLEEAKKRDHRVLWKKLDLFCFSEIVWSWLPLYTPKWTILKELLQTKIENICRNYWFEKVMTPHLSKIDLFKISWHADKFSEELFHVNSIQNHNFAMKPVQCPHQTQIYASKTRSYRDLPIRYMESEKQYRAEKSWEVNGLSRVYAITVEDGHSFCSIDDVKQEVINMVNIIKDFYEPLGLWDKKWVSLSVRDYSDFSKYIWNKEDWDLAEKMLQEVTNEMWLDVKVCEWEAALYGPKIDFVFKDALWRDVQIPTVQLDFAMPKRFNLTYVDKDGISKHPVMVHRAILWSYERLIMLLLEHFAGTFPLWLAPRQAIVIPVSEKFNEYTKKINEKLVKNNLRSEVDLSSDSFAKKIRNAEKMHINYILVVWEEETKNNVVSVRNYKTKEQTVENIENLIISLNQEIESEL